MLVTIGTMITVIIPVTQIARLLMAAWTSPSSNALEVPMACAEVPVANPCATGSSILNILNKVDAIHAPKIPVMMTHATVTEEIPPISSESPIAMAVVMDFGRIDAVNSGESANTADNPTITIIQAMQPAATPNKIAFKLDFNT